MFNVFRPLSPRRLFQSIPNYLTRSLSSSSIPIAKRKASQMDLNSVVSQLHRLAPPSLAEKWDNVGLLVEPSSPHHVERMLLTNDLTEEVLKEAVEEKINFILSYHPPIFEPVKRLTSGSWKQRIVVKCLENRIAVYSPHTSFDASSDGVNSWLTEAFEISNSKPISSSLSSTTPSGFSHKVEAYIPSLLASTPEVNKVLEKLEELMQKSESQNQVEVNFRSSDTCACVLTVHCRESRLPEISAILSSCAPLMKHTEIFKQDKLPLPGHGMGRMCNFKNSISISEAVSSVKKHLGLNLLRVALGAGKTLDTRIENAAVCAGSGSSVLKGCAADLYVTGEMSHHDVLDAVSTGTTVILCEHSNSERGFLKYLAPQLVELLEHKVHVMVSKKDKDPIAII